MRAGLLADDFGSSRDDDLAPSLAGFGAQIDHEVRALYKVEMVFHHDDGISLVDQPLQQSDQQFDIAEVKPGGGFVQKIERAPGAAPCQFARELDALGLSPRKCGRGLAKLQIAEPDLAQCAQRPCHHADVLEYSEALVHAHLEDVGDAATLVADLEGLAFVASAGARAAGDKEIGEQGHLDAHEAIAVAGIAAPARHVEGEAARSIAADARFGHAGEELANRTEGAGEAGGVAAGRAADGRLIHCHHLVHEVEPKGLGVASGGFLRSVQVYRE